MVSAVLLVIGVIQVAVLVVFALLARNLSRAYRLQASEDDIRRVITSRTEVFNHRAVNGGRTENEMVTVDGAARAVAKWLGSSR